MKNVKQIAFAACSLILLSAGWPVAQAQQTAEETLRRTARFTGAGSGANTLYLRNINGSVSITAYEGEEIRITARREFRGSASEIRRAGQEMELTVEEDGDHVLVYLDAPWIEVRRRSDGTIDYRVDRESDDYGFLYDFAVEVPRNIAVDAGTMNRGDVSVTGTRGTVKANTLNGDIELEDITGTTRARTLNGDITARYRESPNEDSEYHTLNGRIEVRYPASLSADIHFKSLRGDLYTDFENVTRLQAEVSEGKRASGSATRFQVDRFAPVRIGSGGPVFRFEVLNGDVYVQKI